MPESRPESPALNAILGERLPILDDGFVRVVDYMGDDSSVVQAARVSYGAGTKRLSDDRALIRYLLRHAHTTPFEMCEIKLHIRAPMDVWRQWVRHRTANVNEYSTRYSVAIDAVHRTKSDQWRLQSIANKQGSAGRLSPDIGMALTDGESKLHDQTRREYDRRLQLGVAREQARKDLPLSTFTEAYWKIDLHNLLHFLELRLAEHAQLEIREYAAAIDSRVLAIWCPLVREAFIDYRLSSVCLSRQETEIVRLLAQGASENANETASEYGWLEQRDGRLLRNRERIECEAKLQLLGLLPPWDR